MTKKRSAVVIHNVCTPKDCRECETLSKKCNELENVDGRADYYEWFLEFMKYNQPFLMARQNGKAIGFVAGEINTGYVLMQLLAVDARYRKLGIGRKLVKSFEKHCLERGIRYFLLYGHKDRVNFFKRMGYTMGSPCFEFMKVFPEKR